MPGTYMIRVCSTKGGVGKSTIAVNLATALQLQGYNTLIVDEDSTNPCVGLYMGLQDVNIGIFDVIKNKADLKRAVIPHPTTGLHVLPGRLGYSGKAPTKKQITNFFQRLKKSSYDFVIVDTQPGTPFPDSIRSYDEALIVVRPNEASNLSALRMVKEYAKQNLKINIVANMVTGRKYELGSNEMQELSEAHVIASMPDDEQAMISTAEHIPLYVYNRSSKFSKAMIELARVYSSRSSVIRESPTVQKKEGFLSRISGK